MSKLHKFLSILLAVMMVISIVPVTASATASGDWEYNVLSEENKTAEITKYNGSATAVVTPTEIDGYKIVSIANHAFEENLTIVSVIISEGVTSVGRYAFNKCESLLYVVIPKGVTKISYGTFSWCFKLRSVAIPDTVTTIEEYAFSAALGLESIFYSGTKEQWKQITINNDDIDFKTATVYYGCGNNGSISGTCGSNVFWNLDVISGVLTISGTGDMKDYQPSHSTGSPTHPWVDLMDDVKYLVIDDGVTSIGRGAFCGFKALESVSIADSVKVIGLSAFDHCERLESVVIPEGVTEIQSYAFRGCLVLTNVTFPSSLVLIDSYAFSWCESLTSVVIPITVQEIGSAAFCNCPNLKAVYYEGTEEQINKILPSAPIYPTFSKATIHFNHGAEHNYNSVVTAPTCTERGYTTYTCECGDSYVDDYVDALGHTPSTAFEENHIAPTCTENGSKDVVVYCSVCEEEISREIVTLEATGHADSDNNGYCDACDELLDPTVECECNCHNDGISGFFWKIKIFFSKLFRTNKMCECGVVHY